MHHCLWMDGSKAALEVAVATRAFPESGGQTGTQRERKANASANTKAHVQIDPLYLNFSCPVGC